MLKILSENLPEIKYASLSSALRKKDVIVDGNRTNENITVPTGGKIEIFLPESAYKTDYGIKLTIHNNSYSQQKQRHRDLRRQL